MPHTVRAYASRSDVETILREDLHGLTSMQLISSLKHFIVLWVQHCRSWTAGVPPSFLASKMLKLSGQWSNFLENRVSQTDFYLWLTLRGPARNLMSYLWSLVEEDAVPALVEQTAELSENDVPEDFASNGSSESLSPPNEFDSPPHRRAKIDHWFDTVNRHRQTRLLLQLDLHRHTLLLLLHLDRMSPCCNVQRSFKVAMHMQRKCLCPRQNGVDVRNTLANMR